MRIQITFLRVTRAPAEKTALLKSRLERRRSRLKEINQEMESGWLDSWQQKVDPTNLGRFYWVGVNGYQCNYNLSGFLPRATTHVLRDNW
ncbi:hypothetical protein V2O64_15885 [Verrucomicrobiaceae bacterium 227]